MQMIVFSFQVSHICTKVERNQLFNWENYILTFKIYTNIFNIYSRPKFIFTFLRKRF